jgi:hypothetical protein
MFCTVDMVVTAGQKQYIIHAYIRVLCMCMRMYVCVCVCVFTVTLQQTAVVCIQ